MSDSMEEMKKWVDNANYYELLEKWRFAFAGNAFFQGEMGDYYSEVMKKKREEIGNAEHVSVSKALGWRIP